MTDHDRSLKRRKIRFMISAAAVILLLAAAATPLIFTGFKQKEAKVKTKAEQTTKAVQTAAIAYQGQPFIGSSKAPVKIAVFSDYRCPYCKQFEEQVVPELSRNYVKTGKASLYFFNNTILGPGSVLAANAAEEVYHQNPKAFFAFHKAVFAAQKSEKQQWVTKPLLMSIAKKTVPDIDLKAFARALDHKSRQHDVDRDNHLADALHVPGTPFIFVNGKMVDGGEDYKVLVRAINRAMNQE